MIMYQCYYYQTIKYNGREYLGKKILTEKFDKLLDAENYCWTYLDEGMDFEEVEE